MSEEPGLGAEGGSGTHGVVRWLFIGDVTARSHRPGVDFLDYTPETTTVTGELTAGIHPAACVQGLALRRLGVCTITHRQPGC